MNTILSCPEPGDRTGPDHGSSDLSDLGNSNDRLQGGVNGFDADPVGSFDVLFESDELLEALAYASGMYGASPNGHHTLHVQAGTETDAAGAGADPPGPPDAPPGGDQPSDDNGGGDGHSSDGRRLCPHGQPLLTSSDLTQWWGPPEPDEPAYWCPLWCDRNRTDAYGDEVDPRQWVHRSLPHQLEIETGGTTIGPDGEEVTGPAVVTVRAQKHPRKQVEFALTLAVAGVEHTCTMSLLEVQALYGFQNAVVEELTGNHLAA